VSFVLGIRGPSVGMCREFFRFVYISSQNISTVTFMSVDLCFRSCIEIRNCRMDGLELDAFAFVTCVN